LPHCLERAKHEGQKLSVLFIDLDDFKNINNTKGHAAGDKVLYAAAQRMKALLRPGDYVVRLGGDEFTVILQRIAGNDHVARVAARLIEVLSQPCEKEAASQTEQPIHASIGISIYPEHGDNMATLLQHADVAMYAAKAAGKGHYQFYAPNLSEAIIRKLTTKQELRHAVEADQFVLHYQPRVDAHTGELLGLEALVRWIHPTRGIVSPLEFIPLAEETGLIVELGALVLEKACAQICAWQSQGILVKPLSVNVSPRQFNSKELLLTIAQCLSRYQIDPSLLELEITESCMMGDAQKVNEDLSSLKAMGVRISVDDFGTGYSSLSQLQRLDIDVLKVDQSFTKELLTGAHGKMLIKTIIAMGHALDMQVVTEGVETIEQLQLLRAMACDEIQGYLISKPVLAEEAAQLISKRFLFTDGMDADPTGDVNVNLLSSL
jgi:diguanylate cyclase (GGDEF)-like protein